ncbi:hypothetical protein ACDQ55_03285 [Chitinophaga sp. 30R24]|uniref:hypothetical protein n=1 Tax=Chitinophaga sp. 30R24 TaxID=3248838 RepID=UPI003B90AD25
MKYLSLLLLATFLFACQAANNTSTPGSQDTASASVSDLLKQYKPIKADTLSIESQYEEEAEKGWAYEGALLDTTFLRLFPSEFQQEGGQFYACYKFNLDANTIGLITRTPSEYSSTSIKLFAWHKQNNKITFETELAEIFGDAGDILNKSSLLYHTPDSGWRGILEKYEYSENMEDTTAAELESYDYYHFKWNGQRIDTISTDSSALVETFKKMSPQKTK